MAVRVGAMSSSLLLLSFTIGGLIFGAGFLSAVEATDGEEAMRGLEAAQVKMEEKLNYMTNFIDQELQKVRENPAANSYNRRKRSAEGNPLAKITSDKVLDVVTSMRLMTNAFAELQNSYERFKVHKDHLDASTAAAVTTPAAGGKAKAVPEPTTNKKAAAAEAHDAPAAKAKDAPAADGGKGAEAPTEEEAKGAEGREEGEKLVDDKHAGGADYAAEDAGGEEHAAKGADYGTEAKAKSSEEKGAGGADYGAETTTKAPHKKKGKGKKGKKAK